MRAIDCPCGHRLEASDDDALFRQARDHVSEHHPDMQRSDQQLRQRVAQDAYDIEIGAGGTAKSGAPGPPPAASSE